MSALVLVFAGKNVGHNHLAYFHELGWKTRLMNPHHGVDDLRHADLVVFDVSHAGFDGVAHWGAQLSIMDAPLVLVSAVDGRSFSRVCMISRYRTPSALICPGVNDDKETFHNAMRDQCSGGLAHLLLANAERSLLPIERRIVRGIEVAILHPAELFKVQDLATLAGVSRRTLDRSLRSHVASPSAIIAIGQFCGALAALRKGHTMKKALAISGLRTVARFRTWARRALPGVPLRSLLVLPSEDIAAQLARALTREVQTRSANVS
jgi:AraC-like DNA-binding protein